MMWTHLFREPVHFPDIDHGGGMYHGRYLDYLDKARQALLRHHGVSFNDLIKSGYALVVVEANLRFFKPVLLEDTLYIYSRLNNYTDKSIGVDHLIANHALADEDLAKPFAEVSDRMHFAAIKLVGVDLKTKRAASLPSNLKFALASMKAG